MNIKVQSSNISFHARPTEGDFEDGEGRLFNDPFSNFIKRILGR